MIHKLVTFNQNKTIYKRTVLLAAVDLAPRGVNEIVFMIETLFLCLEQYVIPFYIFIQVEKQQKVSSTQATQPSDQEKEPLVEIPISIEVEKRDETTSIETPAEKKRKQKRQQFVTIQSIDETAMSTDDSGLPTQTVQSPKVRLHKYHLFINNLQILSYSLIFVAHLDKVV